MRHLITLLLILFFTTVSAQQEVDFLGESMNDIIKHEGEFDDYTIEDNGRTTISYREHNVPITTSYHFNSNGYCEIVTVIMPDISVYDAVQYLSEDYVRVKPGKWVDFRNAAELELTNLNTNKSIVIIKPYDY